MARLNVPLEYHNSNSWYVVSFASLGRLDLEPWMSQIPKPNVAEKVWTDIFAPNLCPCQLHARCMCLLTTVVVDSSRFPTTDFVIAHAVMSQHGRPLLQAASPSISACWYFEHPAPARHPYSIQTKAALQYVCLSSCHCSSETATIRISKWRETFSGLELGLKCPISPTSGCKTSVISECPRCVSIFEINQLCRLRILIKCFSGLIWLLIHLTNRSDFILIDQINTTNYMMMRLTFIIIVWLLIVFTVVSQNMSLLLKQKRLIMFNFNNELQI